MKILIISTSPPDYLGGLAHFTRDLAKNLGDKNIKVDFFCSSLSKKHKIIEKYSKNVRVIEKKCYLFADNDNFLRIKNPLFNTLIFLLKYGKNYDLIHVHSYIYFSTMQTFLYKIFFNKDITIILHLHGGIRTNDFKATSLMEKIMLFLKKYFFDLTIGKIMLKKANGVISVSKDDLLAINKTFKVKRKSNNYYIPNVIDTKNFKKINDVERIYFGFIGRLTHIKGIDLFLELIKKYRKFDENQRFLIIGDGPELIKVEKYIKTYPITFYKKITHKNMPKYYNKCKIFIQTSRAEGLPTTVLEALACEVPVIASNVGGVPEIVKESVNGYIYESGNIEQAINFIKKTVKDDNLEDFGKNGRNLIKQVYSWDNIINKIINIYKKVKNS